MNTKSINDKIAQYPILTDVKNELLIRNLSQKTIINYMDGIARFFDFIEYDNEFEISEDHFRNYLLHLHSSHLSMVTINTYNSFIRFLFSAVLNKPFNTYRVPKAKIISKDIDFLFDNQISELFRFSHSDSRIDCIIKLGICCGLRIDEIISLKVSDINTKNTNNMTVYVRNSKRNKSRYIPLDNTVYRAIQRYAKEYRINPGTDNYFFTFSKKGKSNNETVRYHFNKCKSDAHLPKSFTFHCLRHTYTVNFLRSGGDLLDLKYRLGHSSLAATSRYLHFSRNMMKNQVSYIDTLLKGGVLNAD